MLPRSQLQSVVLDRMRQTALCLAFGVMGGVFPLAAAERGLDAKAFTKYCVDGHGENHSEAEMNLERMLSDRETAKDFKIWRTASRMLSQHRMPPEDAAKPSPEERRELIASIDKRLAQTARHHADDPGEVLLRRLTRAEYEYTVRDLTGLETDLRDQLAGDAVGGEGFANVGQVQFLQDSTLEEYLATAKNVTAHAIIGTGPLAFYEVPLKTGLELSAIHRIERIYREHGFRTAVGEGGEAFGMDLYPKAFFAA